MTVTLQWPSWLSDFSIDFVTCIFKSTYSIGLWYWHSKKKRHSIIATFTNLLCHNPYITSRIKWPWTQSSIATRIATFYYNSHWPEVGYLILIWSSTTPEVQRKEIYSVSKEWEMATTSCTILPWFPILPLFCIIKSISGILTKGKCYGSLSW